MIVITAGRLIKAKVKGYLCPSVRDTDTSIDNGCSCDNHVLIL